MKAVRERSHGRRSLVAAALFLGSIAACAQADREPARPPDVEFVASEVPVVDAMLRLAAIDEDDLVYDLGSGDGRIVIAAAKRFGARGIGIDIDPVRVAESRRNADTAGVERLVEFREADLFETDLRAATVVTLYLLPELNARLRPKLLTELRPGTRVVSHEFDMGAWRPDSTSRALYSSVHLWTVPSTVAGEWTVAARIDSVDRTFTMTLEQSYQQLTGFIIATDAASSDGPTMPVDDRVRRPPGRQIPITPTRVRGDSVALQFFDSSRRLTLAGRVAADTLGGSVVAADGTLVGTWRARRHR